MDQLHFTLHYICSAGSDPAVIYIRRRHFSPYKPRIIFGVLFTLRIIIIMTQIDYVVSHKICLFRPVQVVLKYGPVVALNTGHNYPNVPYPYPFAPVEALANYPERSEYLPRNSQSRSLRPIQWAFMPLASSLKSLTIMWMSGEMFRLMHTVFL